MHTAMSPLSNYHLLYRLRQQHQPGGIYHEKWPRLSNHRRHRRLQRQHLLEPNGSGDVQITGTLYVNASSLNSDLPLYVNSNTTDATIAISRNNDTTERNVTRYHNAAATSTTAPSYYVGEMGGDYGYGVYSYNGSATMTRFMFPPPAMSASASTIRPRCLTYMIQTLQPRSPPQSI